MKNIKENCDKVAKLEMEKTGREYDIQQLLLTEDNVMRLVELLANDEITLLNDIEEHDTITFTDKINWIDFICKIKNKIDKVNYLSSFDDYHYDAFRETIQESANTITIHYNDDLDLGMIRYDFDKIILFDKKHKKQVEGLLNGKVEAYLLPTYNNDTIEAIIEEL